MFVTVDRWGRADLKFVLLCRTPEIDTVVFSAVDVEIFQGVFETVEVRRCWGIVRL